jgi:hypothetical protein
MCRWRSVYRRIKRSGRAERSLTNSGRGRIPERGQNRYIRGTRSPAPGRIDLDAYLNMRPVADQRGVAQGHVGGDEEALGRVSGYKDWREYDRCNEIRGSVTAGGTLWEQQPTHVWLCVRRSRRGMSPATCLLRASVRTERGGSAPRTMPIRSGIHVWRCSLQPGH